MIKSGTGKSDFLKHVLQIEFGEASYRDNDKIVIEVCISKFVDTDIFCLEGKTVFDFFYRFVTF